MEFLKRVERQQTDSVRTTMTDAKDIYRANLERNASNSRQTQLEQLVTIAKEIQRGESQDK